MKNLSFIIILFTFSSLTNAQAIFEKLPKIIKANEHYVFYSHGLIVEGDNPKPVHGRFGKYDFPAIKNALADEKYNLIAYHRPLKTDPFKYASALSKQVTTLLNNGVAPKNITLIGFSRGGFITALASNLLANKALNFVIMAACTSRLAKNKELVIHGNLLSIYETTDGIGSCNDVISRNPEAISSYKEVAITTGKEHGAFYTPDPAWLIPLKTWLKKQDNE